MKRTLLVLSLALAGLMPLAHADVKDGHALPPGISWQQGNVEAAFTQARAENKPLFLYWGAVWCPPCNQVKSTIFNRPDFIAATRQFVPVYLDGDSDNAQQWGEKFKVRGYPTMILFKPDGTEIVRLPGEVDPERYLRTLQLGLLTAKPVKALLADALAGKKLAEADWQLLADYSWDQDQGQLVPESENTATLLKLAQKVPSTQAVALRLQLKALAAAVSDKDAPAFDKSLARARVESVLSSDKLSRDNADFVLYNAADAIKQLSDGQERDKLNQALETQLAKLENDASLSWGSRLDATSGLLALYKQAHPKQTVSAELQDKVRKQVAAADKASANPYQRQAVITAAGEVLSDAGLLDESDSLLKGELKTSHAPYYHMLILASNAKERGDKAAALDWYQKAYQAAEGQATRLQWGASYVAGAVDLAPQDASRIETAASEVFADAGKSSGAFYERSRRSLEKVAKRLQAWNQGGAHRAQIDRLAGQLDGVCGKLPAEDAQKPICDGLVKSLKS
ncbi:thioredoxin family protein [Chromobacterium sp. IIBBL 290-4]|uniref:thioredoxin family protein n=1 Tax=Chromobacterium sp. IIBBL 290-4 TaxID=2953890 RepID=UPI0020B66CCC|nr:thioredoxin fold domain-containing protein [Chromobacterium sp. IIBBL 290-4]UTH73806.1 thioredoxin family protein [Chromobacterium sp. IIBBL 290-4]